MQSHAADTDCYSVTLTLRIEDVGALWNAAMAQGLAAGMQLEEVIETIGPREDPEIADCIAMLAAPAPMPGCSLDDLRVREAIVGIGSTEAIELASAEQRSLRTVAAG